MDCNWGGACMIVATNASEVYGEHGGALKLGDCTQWDVIK